LTLWQIDEDDELQVPVVKVTPPEADIPELEKQLSLNEEHNTEEPPLAEPMSPERAGSPPQASLNDKIDAAAESIDAVAAKEQEAEAAPVEPSEVDEPQASVADVEATELAPATTDPATTIVPEEVTAAASEDSPKTTAA
jgi:hypothetical protein